MSEQQRSPSGDNNNSNQNDAANHRLGASDSSVSIDLKGSSDKDIKTERLTASINIPNPIFGVFKVESPLELVDPDDLVKGYTGSVTFDPSDFSGTGLEKIRQFQKTNPEIVSSVSSFRWDYNVPQSASDDPMLESRLVCMIGFSVRYINRPAKQFFVVVEDVPENWNEFSVRSVIEAVAYQQLFSYDGPCQCGATSIVCNCCEAMWVNRIQNGLVSCSFADSKLGQDLNLVPKASVETSELHSH